MCTHRVVACAGLASVTKTDGHFQGLEQMSRVLRRERRISSRVAARLRRDDAAFQLTRHVTVVSAQAMLDELCLELGGREDNYIRLRTCSIGPSFPVDTMDEATTSEDSEEVGIVDTGLKSATGEVVEVGALEHNAVAIAALGQRRAFAASTAAGTSVTAASSGSRRSSGDDGAAGDYGADIISAFLGESLGCGAPPAGASVQRSARGEAFVGHVWLALLWVSAVARATL